MKLLLILFLFLSYANADFNNLASYKRFIPAEDGWFIKQELDITANTDILEFIPMPSKAMKKDVDNIVSVILNSNDEKYLLEIIKLAKYSQVIEAVLNNKYTPFEVYVYLTENEYKIDSNYRKILYKKYSEINNIKRAVSLYQNTIQYSIKNKIAFYEINKFINQTNLEKLNILNSIQNMANIKTLIEKKLKLYSFKDIDMETLSKLSLNKILLIKKQSINTLKHIVKKENNINQLNKLYTYTIDKTIKRLIENKIKQVISNITSIDEILFYIKSNNKTTKESSILQLVKLIKETNSLQVVTKLVNHKIKAVRMEAKKRVRTIISYIDIDELSLLLLNKNKFIKNTVLNIITMKLKENVNYSYVKKYLRSDNIDLKRIALKQYKKYKNNLFGKHSLYDIPIQKLYKYDINIIDMYLYFLNEKLKYELKENKFDIEKQKKLIKIISLITTRNIKSYEAKNIIDTMSYFKNLDKNIKFQIIKLLFESDYEMARFDDFKDYSHFVKDFSSLNHNNKLYIYYVMNIKSFNLSFYEKIQGWIKYQNFSSVTITNIIFSSIIFLLIVFKKRHIG